MLAKALHHLGEVTGLRHTVAVVYFELLNNRRSQDRKTFNRSLWVALGTDLGVIDTFISELQQ
jgi:hypothetical protein